MNEKQADLMLKSLKRIENFLEAIDWKLWNFHEKILKNNIGVEEVASDIDKDEEKELVDLVEKESLEIQENNKQENKKSMPAYPTIAKWSMNG